MSPSNYKLLEHILDEINFVLDSTARIDYEIVWNIIVEKLPELKEDILQLIEESKKNRMLTINADVIVS